MLQQPMREKLEGTKLHGMIEALEQQEQDKTARELNFLDRVALLVDQQWTWRQNQMLARRPQDLSPERRSLRGKNRLSDRTRTQQECGSCTRPRFRLGEKP